MVLRLSLVGPPLVDKVKVSLYPSLCGPSDRCKVGVGLTYLAACRKLEPTEARSVRCSPLGLLVILYYNVLLLLLYSGPGMVSDYSPTSGHLDEMSTDADCSNELLKVHWLPRLSVYRFSALSIYRLSLLTVYVSVYEIQPGGT